MGFFLWAELLSSSTPSTDLAFTSESDSETDIWLARELKNTSVSDSEGSLRLGRVLEFQSMAESSSSFTILTQNPLNLAPSVSPSQTMVGLARLLEMESVSESESSFSLQIPMNLSLSASAESDTEVRIQRGIALLSVASSETSVSLTTEAQLSFVSEALSDTRVYLGRQLEFSSSAPSRTEINPYILTPTVSQLPGLKVNQPPRTVSPWVVNSIWANIVGATDQLQGFVQATSTSVQAEGSSLVPVTWTVQTDYAGFMASNPTDGSVQYFFPSEPGFYRFQVKSLATNSASGNAATLSILKNGVGNPVDASVSGGSLQSLSGEMVYYLNGKTDKVWVSLQSTSTAVGFTTTLQVEPLYLGAQP